jgi:hypothetical protein
MHEPNAHALIFRNKGDVDGSRSMFKDGKRAQPVEKAPARECDGGRNVSNERQSSNSGGVSHARLALFVTEGTIAICADIVLHGLT